MRSLVILAACSAVAVTSFPLVAGGQTMNQTTTQIDAQIMWEKVKGSWNQTKGALKEQWGELTDDDLLAIEGRRDQLVGKIQTRYGVSREAAEAQVGAWETSRLKDM
jgi:uncharacterized protein YjbJ (UPF0337 family)